MSLTKMAIMSSALAASASADSMTCGTGVSLCGVLTIQSGLGSGVYKHAAANVHGLWPETGNYGTSQCIAPKNKADPTTVYPCYSADPDALQFEVHEWEKHGACAGSQDADDFFGQICSISAPPVAALQAARTAAGSSPDFDSLVTTMKATYPVFSVDNDNMQLSLPVCAGSDGKWKISAVADFATNCGAGSSPVPSVVAPPPPPVCSTTACPSVCECTESKCVPEMNACLENTHCASLQTCVAKCECGHHTCTIGCALSNPLALFQAKALLSCTQTNCFKGDSMFGDFAKIAKSIVV